MIIRTGIITISDRGARAEREDTSSTVIRELLSALPVEFAAYDIIPDEEEEIKSLLINYADDRKFDLIVTTGGTGLSPRDVTPEATRAVIQKEIPGLSEAMRRAGTAHTPYASLSRAVVGIRGQSLIINLPGSPKAVRENLQTLLPVLTHAVEKIKGDPRDCARPDG